MPTTSPVTKPEGWADEFLIRPAEKPEERRADAPRFDLLESGWPDLSAMALAVVFLSLMVSGSIVLSQVGKTTFPAPSQTAQDLVLVPKEPESTSLVEPPSPDQNTNSFPQSAEPVTADPPAPELAEIRPPSAPVQPSRAEPLRPTPLKIDPPVADTNPNEPLPRELMETPPPEAQDKTTAAARRLSSPLGALQTEVSKVASIVSLPTVSKGAGTNLKPPSLVPTATDTSAIGARRTARESLGVLPLSDLIDDEAGLAAGLGALPDAQRVNLPRVSIRVNAEWFAALSQTRERLYFSITPPQTDAEVLAYIPSTRSFELERPERPLWQIRAAEGVPVLAKLRETAGRWLGVSPELVGLYTWHPPVLEDALRMFVLQRMQELHVQLGPRDLVTVRLANGPSGTVMNLEPIRATESR